MPVTKEQRQAWGRKGGLIRAQNLPPERRKEIMARANRIAWASGAHDLRIARMRVPWKVPGGKRGDNCRAMRGVK